MKDVIEILIDLKSKTEKNFIENSIICYQSVTNNPIPDVESDLRLLISLNKAILILERERELLPKTEKL